MTESIDKLFEYYNQFVTKLQNHYNELSEEERRSIEDKIDDLCIQLSKNIYYIESHSKSIDKSSIEYYQQQTRYMNKVDNKENTRDVNKESIS